MEFKLVKEMHTDIERVVNQHIQNGWKLYGDPFAVPVSHAVCQAMTKGDYRSIKKSD